jgi:hypothetical protein
MRFDVKHPFREDFHAPRILVIAKLADNMTRLQSFMNGLNCVNYAFLGYR